MSKTVKRARRVGLTLALVSATTMFGGGADAGVGDVILNEGPATMLIDGGFMNLAGNNFNIPTSSDPVMCNDGVNNDASMNGGDPQDVNVDYDGVDNINANADDDVQCATTAGVCTEANDNSEIKPGCQPKVPISVGGDVAADGTVDITSVTIPPQYLFARVDPVGNPSGGSLVLDVTFTADTSGTDNGSLDPATGEAALDINFSMRIVQAFFNFDCTIGPIAFTLSTDGAAPENGGSIPVSQSLYDDVTGEVTASNNIFTIPGAVVTPGGNPSATQGGCDLIGGNMGVPSASGASAAQFYAVSTPVFTSGISNDPISGKVTAQAGGAPIQGIVVTLMEDHPSWTIVDTTITDSSGNYSFTGLADGTYRLKFWDPTATYARTWYDNSVTYRSGTGVGVSAGTPVVVNEDLPAKPGGAVHGRAQDTASNPLAGIRVKVYRENGATDEYVAGAVTGADGYWIVGSLPAGTYYVHYKDPTNTYMSQWYNFKLLGFNKDSVVVGSSPVWASALMG